jgi:hypothetical protein
MNINDVTGNTNDGDECIRRLSRHRSPKPLLGQKNHGIVTILTELMNNSWDRNHVCRPARSALIISSGT